MNVASYLPLSISTTFGGMAVAARSPKIKNQATYQENECMVLSAVRCGYHSPCTNKHIWLIDIDIDTLHTSFINR